MRKILCLALGTIFLMFLPARAQNIDELLLLNAGGLYPVLDLDFRNGAALDSRFTFARASAVQDFGCSGTAVVLTSFSSGVPDLPACDFYGGTANRLGLGIWRAANVENKWARDLTNAVWVKSSMTAALNAVGIDGNANTASTLTATGINATVQQAIGGTGNRLLYAFVKRKTGTGPVYIYQDGGATLVQIDAQINSNGFTLVPNQQTDPCAQGVKANVATNTPGFKIATSGDEIIVDYVQSQTANNGATCPLPPIATTASFNGATSADTLSMLLSAIPGLNPNSWTIVARFQPGFGQTTAGTCYSGGTNCPFDNGVWQIDDGSNANAIVGRTQWGQHFVGGTGDDDVNVSSCFASGCVGGGKARCASDPANPLATLVEIRSGKPIEMAISYDRLQGLAIACQHNGIGPTTSIVSTTLGTYALGVFTRLQIGTAPAIGVGALDGWLQRLTIYNGFRSGDRLTQALLARP